MTTEHHSESPHFEIQTDLSRDLGLVSALAIGIGTMIAAGIFTLSGLAISYVGSSAIIAFLVAAAVALLTALTYCEFTSIYPESGEGYLYARKTFAPPLAYMVGWCLLLGYTSSCAFYLASLSSYFNEFIWHSPYPTLAGLVILVALTMLNTKGTKESGAFQIAVTSGKLVLLVWFVLGGLQHFDPARFIDKFSTDVVKIGSTATMVFITFFGFSAIAASAGEVRNPTKTIPRAIFISMGVTTVLYTLVVMAVIAANLTEYTESAMGSAARIFLGPIGGMVIVAGALFSMISASNASILAGSRVALSMSRLGHLPRGFGAINPKTRTPVVALVLVGLGIGMFSVTLPLEELAHFADVVLLSALILVNACLIKHRRMYPNLVRPFRVPLVPVVPILGMLANLYLLTQVPHLRPMLLAVASLSIGFLGFLAWKGTQTEELRLPGGPSRVAIERPAETKSRFRLLLPVANPHNVNPLVDLAAALTLPRSGEIIVLRVMQVPDQLPPAEQEATVNREEQVLAQARSRALQQGVPVTSVVSIGHGIARAILDSARTRDCDMILIGWKGYTSTAQRILGQVADDVVAHARRDILLAKMVGHELPKKLFLPSAGGAHAERAGEYAASIAAAGNGSITLCSIVKPGDSPERIASEEERLTRTAERLQRTTGFSDVDTLLVRHRSIVGGILHGAKDYDAIVIGAAEQRYSSQVIFGGIPEQVARRFKRSVIVVKKYRGVSTLVKRVMTE